LRSVDIAASTPFTPMNSSPPLRFKPVAAEEVTPRSDEATETVVALVLRRLHVISQPSSGKIRGEADIVLHVTPIVGLLERERIVKTGRSPANRAGMTEAVAGMAAARKGSACVNPALKAYEPLAPGGARHR